MFFCFFIRWLRTFSQCTIVHSMGSFTETLFFSSTDLLIVYTFNFDTTKAKKMWSQSWFLLLFYAYHDLIWFFLAKTFVENQYCQQWNDEWKQSVKNLGDTNLAQSSNKSREKKQQTKWVSETFESFYLTIHSVWKLIRNRQHWNTRHQTSVEHLANSTETGRVHL